MVEELEHAIQELLLKRDFKVWRPFNTYGIYLLSTVIITTIAYAVYII
jgi:hypothetical protein